MRIALVAHSLSSNIGDRYQGTGIMRLFLASFPDAHFDFINSHPFNDNSSSRELSWERQGRYSVLDPDVVDWESYDVAVLATGSISGDALHCRWADALLRSKRTRRLVIWGGFHDITDFEVENPQNTPLRRIFRDKRTYFFSRGWLELVVHKFISHSERGYCGGDPVLLNDFSSLRRLPHTYRSPLLVISGHVFADNDADGRSLLSTVAEEFPVICSVEGVEDKRIVSSLNANVTLANTLEKYADLALKASIVVTQRLHGIALAKAVSPGLPVLCWVPERNRVSHIKFRSVVETATGFGQPIAHYFDRLTAPTIRAAIDNPDTFLRREHEINFERYCHLTYATFDKICDIVREM